jgi:hypothetical protein
MPGMNSRVNVDDPTVIAAFKAVLLHQGLIALLMFALLGGAWVGVRAWLPRAARDSAGAAPGAPAHVPAGPAGRRLLGIGFGLLWTFDGILQAQPKMALGLPSQVIEPVAASSPRWVQHGVLCLADWVLIEDFGFFGGLGTDPNSMIPFMLLAVAGYLALALAPPGAMEPAAAGAAVEWRDRLRLASLRRSVAAASFQSVIAAAAVGVIILGAAPMAAAQASPIAWPRCRG